MNPQKIRVRGYPLSGIFGPCARSLAGGCGCGAWLAVAAVVVVGVILGGCLISGTRMVPYLYRQYVRSDGGTIS